MDKGEPQGLAGIGRASREVGLVALGVVALAALTWATRGELGMTWDEPYFFERQHDIRAWLADTLGPAESRAEAFSPSGLDRSWRVCRAVPDQHPPLPEWLSLGTGLLFEGLLGPLRAYRLSTVMVFGVAAGVLFRFLRQRWGWLPACAGLGALVFNPRIFAHAQLITADVDMAAFWFLAAVAYVRSVETGRAPWAFGLLAGVSIMAKAMGVLVLPAVGLWAVLTRPSGWKQPLVWSLVTTPAAMYALNPGWWPTPIDGMVRWVQAFLAYPQKVPVAYLGKVYDSVETFLPWHNAPVLTTVMVPPGLLALALLGLLALALRSRSASGAGLVSEAGPTVPGPFLPGRSVAFWGAVNFLTLLGLRGFSFMPAHDGLRQLVPAFFFMPVLAAYGIHAAGSWRGRAGRSLAALATAAGVGSAAVATIAIHPFELSYYNALIGGPKGAAAAGMETTYFWDGATVEALAWMNANLPLKATVLIVPPPNVLTFGWEQRWGRLRPDLRFLNLDQPEGLAAYRRLINDSSWRGYVVFMPRQGLILPVAEGEPAPFSGLLNAPALYESVPTQVGERVLAVFNQDQARAAIQVAPNP